jgi:hypothetical protein
MDLVMAAQWVQKKAAWGLPGKPDPDPSKSDAGMQNFLLRNVPVPYALRTIGADPTLSFQDRLMLNTAVMQASQSAPEPHAIGLRDLLPALAGAGLGYMGAAMTAPIFGLTPQQKRFYGIGGAALGAVMNTMGRS